MQFTKTEGYFTSEEQAFAEIASRGWHAMVITASEEKELHWHDFDAVAFILEGPACAEFPDGSVQETGAGARVEAPAGIVHRNVGSKFRAILGFSIEPARMTRPVNKPVVTSTT